MYKFYFFFFCTFHTCGNNFEQISFEKVSTVKMYSPKEAVCALMSMMGHTSKSMGVASAPITPPQVTDSPAASSTTTFSSGTPPPAPSSPIPVPVPPKQQEAASEVIWPQQVQPEALQEAHWQQRGRRLQQREQLASDSESDSDSDSESELESRKAGVLLPPSLLNGASRRAIVRKDLI